MARLAASLLGANPGYLAQAVLDSAAAGVPMVHIDAMDGNFVPNIAFGPDSVRALRPLTRQHFDVHLMMLPQADYLERYAEAGADSLTVHLEVGYHHHRLLERIKSLGCQAGLALNPGTPLEAAQELLPYIDTLLIMSVNPGFAGGTFIASMEAKIAKARCWREDHGWRYQISVDGGVNEHTLPRIVRAGADILVCGAALYGNGHVRENADQLQRLVAGVDQERGRLAS